MEEHVNMSWKSCHMCHMCQFAYPTHLLLRLINCDLSWLEPSRPQWMCRVTFRRIAALLGKTRTDLDRPTFKVTLVQEWSMIYYDLQWHVKTINGLNAVWTENHSDAFEILLWVFCPMFVHVWQKTHARNSQAFDMMLMFLCLQAFGLVNWF